MVTLNPQWLFALLRQTSFRLGLSQLKIYEMDRISVYGDLPGLKTEVDDAYECN